ncbi:hypothetical protein DFH27DRAFT_614326 [Peziza echinospora]|nr:hypothetical protein DFH27DRAFT_614326 [Peziza echinospora]
MDRHIRRSHLHHAKRDAQVKSIVVETVYKTLTPTFTGSVAGYSTALVTSKQTTAPAPTTAKTTAKTTATVKVETSQKPSSAVVVTQKGTTTTTVQVKPTIVNDKTDKEDNKEEDVIETSISSSVSGFITQTTTLSSASKTIGSAQNTVSPSATNNPVVNKSSGGANTAGIVGGSIAGILVFLAIIAFFYRKRQQKRMNEAYGPAEDEKFGAVAPKEKPITGSSSLAQSPRLSLRPVTQFMPNLNPPAASPVVKTGPATSHEIARKPIPVPLALAKSPMAAGSDAQPSPTLSAFSDGYAAPGTPVQGDAGAIAAGEKLSPVYRVQMDYLPVQPDELEIRTGALVRMIHEYDDGWALCIRMDRSQQGVCPRTCLSARPVKPRPNPAPGSPVQSQQRRGPPANANAPYSPGPQYGNQGPQQPYAQSSGSRPQTPTQNQQYRQQSPMTPQQQSVPQITVSHSNDVGSPQSQRQAPRGPTFHAM